jgi:hypothetical protein
MMMRIKLLKKYNLTLSQYQDRLKFQNNQCPICHSDNPTNIDHDHITGKVRGILCSKCNTGLGCFRDNPEFLENAKIYLL